MTQAARDAGLSTPSAAARPSASRAGTLARLIAILLIVEGGLGLLTVPMIAKFSEGVPQEIPIGAYAGIVGLAAVACLAAGFAIYRSRPWGRWLGVVVLVVQALGSGDIVLGVGLGGLAAILAFAWRYPRRGA